MASIKVQNLKPSIEGNGRYDSGSAAIVTNEYSTQMNGTGHTAHRVVERLGRVVWLSDDRRKGIFLSDTRGLVEYDLSRDTFDEVAPGDPRIAGTNLAPVLVNHTAFGDTLLAMTVVNRSGLYDILREVFPNERDYERVLCHVLHTTIRNSARISCSNFVIHSALSYAIESINIGTLDRDSTFFDMMGTPEVKLAFFKSYIEYMRKKNPEFGIACYVDSTPLPNDIKDNPWNAFSSHGTSGEANQTRLVLILDSATGRPVWFEFIHGNKLDHTTIEMVENELKIHVNIDVHDMVLDAGYACQELFERYNINNHEGETPDGKPFTRTLVIRMPEKPGYPYGDLYQNAKDHLFNASNTFVRDKHTYFGERFGPIDIMGSPEYVYVYLDMQQALALNQKYRSEYPDIWDSMDDAEKNWAQVKDGYFELICNRMDTPEKIHDEYFSRVNVECFFKTGKEFLGLLPLRKWSKQRIEGKVLCDVIAELVYLELRSAVSVLGTTIPEILVLMSSIECTRDLSQDMLMITTPNKQIRNIANRLDIVLEGHMSLNDFRNFICHGVNPSQPSIQARDPKAGRPKGSGKAKTIRVPLSAEQKEEKRQEKARQKAALALAKKNVSAAEKACDRAVMEADKTAEYVARGKTSPAKRHAEKAALAAQEAARSADEACALEELDKDLRKKALNAKKRAQAAATRADRCISSSAPKPGKEKETPTVD